MPFAIALALSALLHGAAISLPGWDLPGLGEPEPPVIEAHLAPPPAPVSKPAPAQAETRAKPAPRAAAKRVASPAPVAAASPMPADAAPAAATEAVPTPEPAPAPVAVPQAPPTPPFARSGGVRYAVTYGTGGFRIGETVYSWRIEDGRYTLRSAFEPKGLAALRGRTRVQESSGEIVAGGLRPSEFRDQREGRAAEVAAFAWGAGRVVFSGGRGEGGLAEGAQDLLSVFYQLAWLAPRANIDIPVVTGGRIGRSTFEWLGEETLVLAAGETPALRLRTESGGDVTEVWLATRYGGLPLKIRHTDKGGDVFEQVADTLDLN